MLASVSVTASEESVREKARALASSLNLSFTTTATTDFILLMTPEQLELREANSKKKPLVVDFSSFVFRQGKEPIVKAVGTKGAYHPTILDLTAGLGQDAFVLAASGCLVTMCERSPVIAALLQDGLARASQDATLSPIVQRMTLLQIEAADYLQKLEVQPDVIYFDPMYPESGKTAAKRKSMTFFRNLIGDDNDAEEVLELAREIALKRVVVKRPLKAKPLGTKKPSVSIKGRTTRFDLYL